MTPKQQSLYWREWAAVRRVEPLADRHALHAHALGEDKSSKLFSNEDLDKVLGVFRTITRPTSVKDQVRQIRQPRTRFLHKITDEQARLLKALDIEDPISYIENLLIDKFGTRDIDELSELSPGLDRYGKPRDSQLTMLRNTLARCISELRQKKGWSEHDLAFAAGLPCHCMTFCNGGAARRQFNPQPQTAEAAPF